ncbi:MAG: ATP-binding protein [Casimicrobiaceae bacterium]|nr:ATP-binding protein [Casimicrobiaceae bacterium]MDW8311973.1 ATP-binding protein [Burkholderiales bacterium]
MREPPRLVALLGAECTGKTTLAQALAERCGGLWVPEYLRAFCDARGRTPRREEQALIAEMQHLTILAARAEAQQRRLAWVFADTTALMPALYSIQVFGDHSLVERGLRLQRRFDLTLLCAPDLPWIADGIQRDGPETRAAVDQLLRTTLDAHGIAYANVQGAGPDRLAAALKALEPSRTVR